MNDFTYYSPTEFFIGRGVTDQVGQKLAARGYKHALVVYGKGSVVRTGTLDRVKASLAEAGIKVEELAGVRPNPEVGLVREGIELARARRVDCILAVGGGSKAGAESTKLINATMEKVVVDNAVRSEAEAKSRAAALMNELSMGFLTGSLELPGLPPVIPGRTDRPAPRARR